MKANRLKMAVATTAAGLLLLTGCGSDDSEPDGATDVVEADPQQPFWDEWNALSEQDQEALCFANEDFGEGWHVDYVADGDYDTDVDPDAWLEGLVEACEDLDVA